ncbi:MAG: hypothetical protein MHPSP_002555, partial [Paramarteilia canceri]
YGMIGITEPRRVAATNIASRVIEELNQKKFDLVGYQIRNESTVSKESKIKFMTDGILIQEMKSDFMLNKYSVLIIDEAHERSVFTDILIGLLSRVAMSRRMTSKPLRIIIMSATLYIDEFVKNKQLFPEFEPPVIKIESRQYKVNIHQAKKTPDDYISAAYNKVIKIHKNLPIGTILVFLASRKEVTELVEMLKNSEYFQKMEVLPFYSVLDSREQAKVFQRVDYSSYSKQICVVSTNLAETSITIPDVKYVVDT